MLLFIFHIRDAFYNILEVLRSDPSLWLFLIPIFILWFVTEMYYGEYKREPFGFSSALTGALSLVWVSLVAFRVFFLVDERISFVSPAILVLGAFILYGSFVVYVSFRHMFSVKIVSRISAPSLLYFFSLVAVFLGEGVLELNLFVIIAFSLIFLVLFGIVFIIKQYFLGLRGEIERVKEAGN